MSPHQVDIDTEAIQFDGRWLGREDLARTIRSLLDAGNYNIGRHSAALEALNAALADVRTLAFRVTPEQADAITQVAVQQGRTPGAVIREAVDQYLGGGASRSAGAGPSGAPEASSSHAHAPAPAQASAHAAALASAAGAPPRKSEPEGRRPTDPEVPVVAQPAAQEPEPAEAAPAPAAPASEPVTPATPPPPGLKPANPAFVAGPGALKAAGMPGAGPQPSVVVDTSLAQTAEVVTEAASPEEAAAAVDLKPKAKPDAEQDAVERRWFGG